jgi:hypothetical protein
MGKYPTPTFKIWTRKVHFKRNDLRRYRIGEHARCLGIFIDTATPHTHHDTYTRGNKRWQIIFQPRSHTRALETYRVDHASGGGMNSW